MNAIQEHRHSRHVAAAQFLLREDFDSFLYGVDEPIPPGIMLATYREERGDRGWVAFQSKITKKWAKFARKKKLSAQRALFHFRILCESLDYVPEI